MRCNTVFFIVYLIHFFLVYQLPLPLLPPLPPPHPSRLLLCSALLPPLFQIVCAGAHALVSPLASCSACSSSSHANTFSFLSNIFRRHLQQSWSTPACRTPPQSPRLPQPSVLSFAPATRPALLASLRQSPPPTLHWQESYNLIPAAADLSDPCGDG